MYDKMYHTVISYSLTAWTLMNFSIVLLNFIFYSVLSDLQAHDRHLTCACFAANDVSLFATTAVDCSVRLWKINASTGQSFAE